VKLAADDCDKVLAFMRGRYIFAFNFNAERSFTDYGIIVPPATRWRSRFDTDEARFGGQGRIAPDQKFIPQIVPYRNELVQQIKLYLPARTAVVLHRA
jgi:1,4-alpha-glucan branching enzyme